ncbi:MAG: putative peptidoglycan binding protein [Hydrocarboniphaga sp.]|uniref:peptidoglycan-binding domain-containing protein n=1 Tax=Hydrocarboniphaga sp. TaxID=2033016 RepID=UPI002624D885|nr:peptidoglycan-binding domain-containing protein [Hydrocarboniphaga sp.]MDB5972697.1 putative peptidoglycan binding protein [Hydrocarboniphaga sp.]
MLRHRFAAGCVLAAFVAAPVFAQEAVFDTGLPLRARVGECYARVYTPPQFKTLSESVLKKAESERIEVIPERYEWDEQTVMVKPASERIVEVVPAQYRWEEQQLLVKPAAEKLEQVPATYKTTSERQLVKPASQQWKRGHGLVEKVDNLTGDIMCLVESPAEYREVTHSEVDQPATTRRSEIPAEYQTVRRQVLVKEAEVRKEEVPAQYQNIKVRRLVEPARENRIAIPAEYQILTRQEKIADGHMEWRGVLCETNATPDTVRALQQALKSAGYYSGPLDGRIGSGTADGVRRYQASQGMAQGGITLETLERLGVHSAGRASDS